MNIEASKIYHLTWNDMKIEVKVQLNWLGHDYAHLEVRCAQPLPITSTGYRSHFMSMNDLGGWTCPSDFVLAWLEEASQSKDWKLKWQKRQQLSFGF